MKQIRKNVFETNSSSTHSLTMCTEAEYEKWKNGELIYDCCMDGLVEVTEEVKEYREKSYALNGSYMYGRYQTEEEYWEHAEEYYETFCHSYNDVVAFGYYGYDA